MIARHGRWLHLSPQGFQRAERWFVRFGTRAVFFGRLTPVVRSFISIPAGVLGSPLGPYAALTLAASLLWCLGFAGAGWALGDTWHSLHRDFRYADYAAIAGVGFLFALALWRWRRKRSAPDSTGQNLA